MPSALYRSLHGVRLSARPRLGIKISGAAAPPFVQPQITLIDFGDLAGPNFVTGGVGLYLLFSFRTQPNICMWLNTSTETQPSVGAASYFEIDIDPNPFNSAAQIAATMVSRINAAFSANGTALNVDGIHPNTGCQITDANNGPVMDANIGTSATIITVPQVGS